MLLCGGNAMPNSILKTFYEKGGHSLGRLAIIPTASLRADSGDFSLSLAVWKEFAWGAIDIAHAHSREAASDASVLDVIRNATAVWIAGGDQQRLVDRYQNTPVHEELRNLIRRGGVLGGTSAGAAIVSQIMIAGGITQPVVTEGWGLLPDLIIDQHFSQRARFERLARAVGQHPDRVGIGIDESTAILLDQAGIRVLGNGAAYVLRSEASGQAKLQHSIHGETEIARSPLESLITTRHLAQP
jgi:cyanophycinase